MFFALKNVRMNSWLQKISQKSINNKIGSYHYLGMHQMNIKEIIRGGFLFMIINLFVKFSYLRFIRESLPFQIE